MIYLERVWWIIKFLIWLVFALTVVLIDAILVVTFVSWILYFILTGKDIEEFLTMTFRPVVYLEEWVN